MTGRRSSCSDSVTLVRRAQEGDRGAYESLFARYYPRVYRFVRARMGARLRRYGEPEDLVQDTFIQAIRTIERFEVREEARLIDWFAKLVEHQVQHCERHHGAKKRDREREVALQHVQSKVASGELVLDPVRTSTSILDRAVKEEQMRILDECLAGLPRPQREAILLRDYAQGDWDWIAAELDRPSASAARELYRRAMLRLLEKARPLLDP